MVVCKYFQQGICRFGQYCRFEHVNNYSNNNYGGNTALRGKTNDSTKNVALVVAEDILAAERGGQWLLSCFGPFKEQPCIPGMEDLSPEEVRWEMYQAEKTGSMDQAKLQFQQLCQDMKTKRDALKNPTQDIAAVLEKLQKRGQESGFGANNSAVKTTNFSFATPQLGQLSNTQSSSNVFGSNPFGGVTPAFGSTPSTTSVFGGSTASTAASPFGSSPMFAATANNASVFAGATKSSTSMFGASTQSPPSFGSVATQNNSVFSGSNTQSVFGQSAAFGASTQTNTQFARAQPVQSTTSIFGGGTTSTNSLFSGATTAQSDQSIFGVAKTPAPSLFGSANAPQATNSVFGRGTASAFGGAPVFGGAPAFGSPTSAPMFGAQPSFGGVPAVANNVFGGANTVAQSFGTIGQSASTTFASVGQSPSGIFGSVQNVAPFGSTVSTASATPFGPTVSTASSPFGTVGGPFGQVTASSTPFSGTTAFGSIAPSQKTSTPFGVVTSTSTSSFGNTVNTGSPFGSSPFGITPGASPFVATNTTETTTSTNPFGQPQQISSPFSGATSNQGSFGTSPFGSVFARPDIIDDTVYTLEGKLTDDEKTMYLAQQFTLGRIPTKPPTKELR